MADYYTLLTNAGIAYETACKAAGQPIKLSQISVGDGAGAVYNPAATDTALKREVWRGPLNALFQDEKNPSWLLAEVTIPPDVGGWYVREAGIWTDTGILYAIVKYPESFKPVLATSGSSKEFYIRSIFETSNAALVTLLIDDTVVKATRAWVMSYVADEISKLDLKQSVRVATTANIVLSSPQTIDGVALVSGDRVLVKNQAAAKDNGIYVVAVAAWVRAKDADLSAEVTSALTVSVEQGVMLADTIWQLVTDGEIVLGSTALTFQNITQGFAPLNSPVLISPTATFTPPQFDGSKLLATTEFVKRQGKQFSASTSINGSGAIPATSVGQLFALFGSAPSTINLPSAVSLPVGATVTINSYNTVTAAITRAGTDVIYGANPGQSVSVPSMSMLYGDILELTLLSNMAGSGAWYVSGGNMVVSAAVPQFDNSIRIASTQFVQRAQGNFSGQTNITTLPATLTPAMAGRRIVVTGAGTLTLPPLIASPVGSKFYILNIGAGDITVNRQGADTIAALSKAVTNITIQSASNAVVTCGDNNYVVEEGVSSLKYSNEFSALLSANGYQKNPSGLIEQWGIIPAIPANGSILVNFPIIFPVAAAGFSIAGGASGPGIPGVNCYNISNTQVRFWNQSTTVATQAGGYRVVGF